MFNKYKLVVAANLFRVNFYTLQFTQHYVVNYAAERARGKLSYKWSSEYWGQIYAPRERMYEVRLLVIPAMQIHGMHKRIKAI
jgi:hypothetical protein